MKGNVLSLSSKIFSCWLLLVILFILGGGLIFGDLSSITLLDFANWDGRHFLEIAGKGYSNKVQYAFFPLYPLLINLFANFLNTSFLFSGILINLTSVFGSIYMFLKLLHKYKENLVKPTLYLLIFPTSFYLITAYSESLFLFLSLLTFFFAEKRNFFYAAFFAALTSLARITGVAVIVGLAVFIINSNIRLRKKISTLLLSMSGFILYCLYLYVQTGNPFYFFISELTWGRSIEIPGANIRDAVVYTAVNGIRPESFTILSDLLFTIFGLGMGIRVVRFLKPPLAVYTIVALFIPLTTALLLSVPRFLLVVFPIFIVLSKINNRIFNTGYVIISLTLLFLYFNFFLRNIWVS